MKLKNKKLCKGKAQRFFLTFIKELK